MWTTLKRADRWLNQQLFGWCGIDKLLPMQKVPLPDRQLVPDIWQHLWIDEQCLYMDGCAVERGKLKKIVSDQIDNDYALIDFPYNPRLTGYCYPRHQLEEVNAWLRQQLPDIEFIQ